jgi:hypothetical protein
VRRASRARDAMAAAYVETRASAVVAAGQERLAAGVSRRRRASSMRTADSPPCAAAPPQPNVGWLAAVELRSTSSVVRPAVRHDRGARQSWRACTRGRGSSAARPRAHTSSALVVGRAFAEPGHARGEQRRWRSAYDAARARRCLAQRRETRRPRPQPPTRCARPQHRARARPRAGTPHAAPRCVARPERPRSRSAGVYVRQAPQVGSAATRKRADDGPATGARAATSSVATALVSAPVTRSRPTTTSVGAR